MNPPRPEAHYFGSRSPDLFGWLHRPAGDAKPSLGLVICNPFGFEEVCAHRSLRHVAAAAAASGTPALRFDYAGCGNSKGDEFQPDAFAAWIASIHEAVERLKQATGVSRVCLLGLRLGATLAALAGTQRDDVAAWIAIAPIVRGRTYVRELKVLGQAAAARSGDGGSDDRLESAGFLMTTATTEAVSAVDLRKLERAPAPRALIVERDDMPVPRDCASTLQALGAAVEEPSWPGYAAMMSEPHDSLVPEAIVNGVAERLRAWAAELPPAVTPARSAGGVHADTIVLDGEQPVTERPVWVEQDGARLFGILAIAAHGAAPSGVGIVLINSGAVHHIGPNRQWVRLARHWAAQGVAVLRLDISGIGDSPAREGAEENVVYSPYATRDLALAVDYLKREHGVDDCRAGGLCSGAYHAFKAAVHGKPIAAALVINPLTYFWKEGMSLHAQLAETEVDELVTRYRGGMFSRRQWSRLLRGELDLPLIAKAIGLRLFNLVRHNVRAALRACGVPLRDDLASELKAAARHGVRLDLVFADSDPGHDLLVRSAGSEVDRRRRAGSLTINFIERADHTFTSHDSRERLTRLLDRVLLAKP